MRPVSRGPSPAATDYANHRDAFGPLIGRLGNFCSYCERRINTNFAVEHIQPKGYENPVGVFPYKHLSGRWENFLLACLNCNSTKKDKDVVLKDVFLPDRDNTFLAFEYTADGRILPSSSLNASETAMARDTLALTGLDRRAKNIADENGKLVAVERVTQRMEIHLHADTALSELRRNDTPAMRAVIVRLALASGGFSIWMKVFAHDTDMLGRFVVAFDGTATDCFNPTTLRPISPRPANGLAHGGKV